MAKSVNKVILLGNVGKDPEIRSTAGGTMVATFALATSDRFQDRAGQLAGPHRVAQPCRFQAHRRDRPRLCEEGLEALYRRQDSDPQLGRQRAPGQSVYRTEIIVNDLSLLSGRDDRTGGGGTAVRQCGNSPATRIWTSARRRARTTTRNRPRSPMTTFRFK